MPRFDVLALRVELTRRGMTQLDLARALECPVTTLNSWLRGAHPAPADLALRIESALGLPRGAVDADLQPPASDADE